MPSTVSMAGSEFVNPSVAVAVFVTEPASISAWVTISVPEQVRELPGRRPPAGSGLQVTEAIRLSATSIGKVTVTLPVLVTV